MYRLPYQFPVISEPLADNFNNRNFHFNVGYSSCMVDFFCENSGCDDRFYDDKKSIFTVNKSQIFILMLVTVVAWLTSFVKTVAAMTDSTMTRNLSSLSISRKMSIPKS